MWQAWTVGWGEVRHEIKNNLKPPIGLVVDLNGGAAQVSLRAKYDVKG